MVDGLGKGLAYFQLESDTGLIQYSTYTAQLLNVIKRKLRNHDYIIQIHQCKLSAHRRKYDVHCPLKSHHGVL